MEERILPAQALERRPASGSSGLGAQAAALARRAFPLLWLGVWEVASRVGWMDARFFPPQASSSRPWSGDWGAGNCCRTWQPPWPGSGWGS